MICSEGLGQFFCIILNFFLPFMFFFLPASLKKFPEKSKLILIWFCVETIFSFSHFEIFSPFMYFFLPASLKRSKLILYGFVC